MDFEREHDSSLILNSSENRYQSGNIRHNRSQIKEGRRGSLENNERSSNPLEVSPTIAIKRRNVDTDVSKQSRNGVSDVISNASRVSQQIRKVIPNTDNEDPDYLSHDN